MRSPTTAVKCADCDVPCGFDYALGPIDPDDGAPHRLTCPVPTSSSRTLRVTVVYCPHCQRDTKHQVVADRKGELYRCCVCFRAHTLFLTGSRR